MKPKRTMASSMRSLTSAWIAVAGEYSGAAPVAGRVVAEAGVPKGPPAQATARHVAVIHFVSRTNNLSLEDVPQRRVVVRAGQSTSVLYEAGQRIQGWVRWMRRQGHADGLVACLELLGQPCRG